LAKHHVEGLWPKRRLNLIAGASGAGKTRWTIPQLFALQAGQSVMGKPTVPTRIAYVACDRTSEDAKDTMSDLGHDASKMFVFSFMDNEMEWSLQKVVEVLPLGTQLTFVEAIGALVREGRINEYHEVLRFGRNVNKSMRQSGSDFMGSTHTPKLKRDEEFKHTRENVLGSAAWAGIAATIILLDEMSTGQRAVTILPRDAEPQKLIYEFDQTGHLVECCQSVGRFLMDRWLSKIDPGTDLLTTFIMDAGERFKLSRSTTYRWIAEKEEEGRLIKVSHGLYKVSHKT